MNVLEFVFGVILLSTIAGLYRLHLRHAGGAAKGGSDQMRREVDSLRERLAVLERITVDKENMLDREIDKLRDREGAVR
jgi:hypothetical protein